MTSPRTDVPSRINFRPILAGVLVTVALMLFLSTSLRSFFEVTDHYEGGRARSIMIWLAMSSVWIVSVFVGSAFAVLGSRSVDREDGILHGLTVWAGSFLALGILITARAAGYEPIVELNDVSGALIVRDFLGEFAALIASVLGGIVGSSFERRSERQFHHSLGIEPAI